MTIEETIKKAIEGGYRGKSIYRDVDDCWQFNEEFNVNEILLDPIFWQSLGKSLGWKGTGIYKACLSKKHNPEEIMEWHMWWHNFIDYLIDGGTIESFFTELEQEK